MATDTTAWSAPHWVLVKFKGMRSKWGCEKKTPLGPGTRIRSRPGDQRGSQHGLQTISITWGWKEKKSRRPSADSQVSICEVSQKSLLTHLPVWKPVVDNFCLLTQGWYYMTTKELRLLYSLDWAPSTSLFPRPPVLLHLFFFFFFPTYLSPATYFT